jgi:hypothetical protein
MALSVSVSAVSVSPAASLDFDWLAPVPQLFTRCDGRAFWPSDRRYQPLDERLRYARDLRFLLAGLPPCLAPVLRQRFKPSRGPLRWDTPPALPTSTRQCYEASFLRDTSATWLLSQVTVTAGMIERLLTAPEGMVGGLTHNYLLLMQMLRLRQLWEEVERRAWEDAPLVVFTNALG